MLTIEYDGRGGAHHDLVLCVGSCRHVADTYYLAIDESPAAGHAVPSAIVRLLDQWLDDLESLRPDRTSVVLPFDFSDQCTAWLEVTRAVDGVMVVAQLGWSNAEGYSFLPSDYAAKALEIGSLDPIEGARVECTIGELVAAVEQARASFADSSAV